MFGLNRRLDRVQGRRPRFVRRKPIIKTLCATVGFSDVTSANIVGYHNDDLDTDGMQFKAASFTTIGVVDAEENPCVRLSDLRITGYEEAPGYCMKGDVWIDMLNPDGSIQTDEDGNDIQYNWQDWGGAGEWLDAEGNTIENPEEITFAVGTGLNLNVQYGCEEWAKLASSGEIYTDSLTIPLVTDGQNYVGNPLARTITLDEIAITGYEEDPGYCMKGDVWIDMLNPDGSIQTDEDGNDIQYYWQDWGGAGEWLDTDGNPIENPEEIAFEIGDGLDLNVQYGCEEWAAIKFPALVPVAE